MKKHLWLDGDDFWIVKTKDKKLILYKNVDDAMWYARKWNCTVTKYTAEYVLGFAPQ